MPNKKELRELIESTRQHINLREAVIEKDYYVTQVIHKLSNVENEYFRLVFCGGTCLAKAHKLVQRMSEDIDFKIQLKSTEKVSKSRLKNELKEFRTLIRSVLTLPDLSIINDVTRNEGRYHQISLKYPHSFAIGSTLRPDIKTEFTFADILLPTNKLTIKTIIEDTLDNVSIFTPPSTSCVSIDETAIEKWVALTRRIMAIERGYESDDKTLIRHVYDLNAINQANKINPNFSGHAKVVITSDGKQFKNQHPEYASDPVHEIKQSLAQLKNNSAWRARYEEFIETMIYGNTHTTSYDETLITLENYSASVINFL